MNRIISQLQTDCKAYDSKIAAIDLHHEDKIVKLKSEFSLVRREYEHQINALSRSMDGILNHSLSFLF